MTNQLALCVSTILCTLGAAAAFSAESPHMQDKPAGPQSLPGDQLPPFNMLDAKGKLIPMPQLKGPIHPPGGGGPESTAAGPGLDISIAMARAAVTRCKSKGYLVGVTVIDSIGEARAMLTADGSDGSHVFVAQRKALTALVFGMTSFKANQAVTSGKAPMNKVMPAMFVMGGAVPILRGGKMIGAIGVSGAAGSGPPGKEDEDCAYAGIRAAGPTYAGTAAN